LRLCLALLALTLLHPIAALANSSADELARIGFLGEWAEDCDRPAAADNLRYVVRGRADGSAEAYGYVDEGADPAVVTTERFVAWRGTDLIEIRTDYIRPATYAPVQAIVKIEAGRLRFMAATGLDGKELIRDGRLVDDDRPTPWFYRCDGKPAS
jgi:hypothetical protein